MYVVLRPTGTNGVVTGFSLATANGVCVASCASGLVNKLGMNPEAKAPIKTTQKQRANSENPPISFGRMLFFAEGAEGMAE